MTLKATFISIFIYLPVMLAGGAEFEYGAILEARLLAWYRLVPYVTSDRALIAVNTHVPVPVQVDASGAL